MEKADSSDRMAFTMLELVAVMVLLGLISVIAMISIVGHLERSELVRVAQQIANADRKEREATRLSPFPGGLTYEPNKQRLQYLSSRRKIEMGNRVKIAELVVSRSLSLSGDVLFTQAGQSQTYAIRLESQRGASQWILIVGMTGQVIVSDHSSKYARCWRWGVNRVRIAYRRNAFTLLEVVVGLVLMGTLVASALVALSAQSHSIQLAKTKKEANQIAEKLLTSWYEVRGKIPLRDQGIVQQNQEWVWRTYAIGTKTVCGLEANIVRLEVVGRAGTEQKPTVLVSLELLQSPNASGLQ